MICCIVTMLCWGSWANTQKLAAGHWRFELFYWDYVVGILLFSLVLAFTLGSMGSEGRGFVADLSQAGGSSIGSAILGGIIFNAANILLGAAIAIAGMAVAFPVGIGLALVIGVVVNYIAHPMGDVGLLAGGVGLIVVGDPIKCVCLQADARRPGKANDRTSGLALAVAAGMLMGFFYKYVAASMFADFEAPEPGKLTPYTAVVIFSAGILLSNLYSIRC